MYVYSEVRENIFQIYRQMKFPEVCLIVCGKAFLEIMVCLASLGTWLFSLRGVVWSLALVLTYPTSVYNYVICYDIQLFCREQVPYAQSTKPFPSKQMGGSTYLARRCHPNAFCSSVYNRAP